MDSRMAKGPFIINENQAFRTLDLLSFQISIYVSYYLCGNVFPGAALFLAGFVLESFLKLYPHRRHMSGKFVLPLLAAVLFALAAGSLSLSLYPHRNNGILTVVVLLLILRSVVTHMLILRFAHDRRGLFLRVAAAQLALTAALPFLLAYYTGWGFAQTVCILSAIYPLAVLGWLLRSRNKKILENADYNAGRVASYRKYNALLLCSNIASYLSVMTYAGILAIMPMQGDTLLPVVLWVALVITVTVIIGRIFRRGRLQNIEKNSLFISGGVVWLFAFLQLNQSFILLDPSLAWVWSLLQAVGIAFMLLLATFMQEDMRLVLEVTGDAGEASIKTFRALIQQAAFIIAGTLMSVELYCMNLVIEGRLPFAGDPAAMRSTFMTILNLLPMGFVLLSMFFALIQPLSRDVVRKLKLYREQKLSQSVVLPLEAKLKRLLVRRYRKRIGVKILAFFIKPLWPHRVTGTQNVRLDAEPVVFVANHREIYGPVITNLYLPFSFRPWIEHNMLQREKIMDYLWDDPFSRIKPVWLARLALRLAGPLLIWILNSVEPIPVYRGGTWESIRTIKASVAALLEQDNILLFPENPAHTGGRYATAGVSPFYKGFVSIAKMYYKKTGKALTFYPVFADARKRTITIGQGVPYDPDGDDENERVCAALTAAMICMAGPVDRSPRNGLPPQGN
jgi:hypothetical protein